MKWKMTTKDVRVLIEKLAKNEVSADEALKLLPNLMVELQKRTHKLRAATKFINEVAEEDRLYVSAFDVWRRKGMVKRIPEWTRANAPDRFRSSAH